jgi:PPIC-type PPIASE domain
MRLFAVMIFVFSFGLARAQNVATIKQALQTSPNPVGYVRDVLKKKFVIDTIIIKNSTYFQGTLDSLAYKGTVKKVYGPYAKRVLMQILGKANNQFTRFSQIFIDTSTFSFRVGDSITNVIMERVKNGSATFEDMAQAYSMGGEGPQKGDLGWVARGAVQPDIEKALALHKKGEVFKFYSRAGIHLMKKTAGPKEDTGFVLIMRIFL